MNNRWEEIRDEVYSNIEEIPVVCEKINRCYINYEELILQFDKPNNIIEELEIICALVGDLYLNIENKYDTYMIVSNPTFFHLYNYMMEFRSKNIFKLYADLTNLITNIFGQLHQVYRIIVEYNNDIEKISNIFKNDFSETYMKILDESLEKVTDNFLETKDDIIEDILYNINRNKEMGN